MAIFCGLTLTFENVRRRIHVRRRRIHVRRRRIHVRRIHIYII
jgi:hypothetical protein